MDIKSLKKEIENLKERKTTETLQKILYEMLKRIEKIEPIEDNLARLIENFACANLDSLLQKEDQNISIEYKKIRIPLKDENGNIIDEIDCLGTGKQNGSPILIVVEVKTSVRDEDIDKIFYKMKEKREKILKHKELVIQAAGFPEEYIR